MNRVEILVMALVAMMSGAAQAAPTTTTIHTPQATVEARASTNAAATIVLMVINGQIVDVTGQVAFDDGHVFLNGVFVGFLVGSTIYSPEGAAIGVVLSSDL